MRGETAQKIRELEVEIELNWIKSLRQSDSRFSKPLKG